MKGALILALTPKKGKGPMGMKGGKPDMPMGSESDSKGEGEDMHEEAKAIFVDAAKDGDWAAAFDALMSCMEHDDMGSESESEDAAE